MWRPVSEWRFSSSNRLKWSRIMSSRHAFESWASVWKQPYLLKSKRNNFSRTQLVSTKHTFTAFPILTVRNIKCSSSHQSITKSKELTISSHLAQWMRKISKHLTHKFKWSASLKPNLTDSTPMWLSVTIPVESLILWSREWLNLETKMSRLNLEGSSIPCTLEPHQINNKDFQLHWPVDYSLIHSFTPKIWSSQSTTILKQWQNTSNLRKTFLAWQTKKWRLSWTLVKLFLYWKRSETKPTSRLHWWTISKFSNWLVTYRTFVAICGVEVYKTKELREMSTWLCTIA